MEFGYIGINYKNANQDIRDQVSFTDSQKIDFLQEASLQGIGQCMVLSTCNRSEVFFFAQEPHAFSVAEELYRNSFPGVEMEACIRRLAGNDAVSYLFRVTAGMESMIAGEDQILGQVKDAFDLSKTLGCTGKELNKVVRDAVTCAKKIKTELKVSEQPLSVSYVGIRKLEEEFGISGKKAFVIGSGNTAVLAIRYLYEYGAGSVCVCSRTAAHAGKLKREFPGLSVAAYEDRYDQIAESDIIVSATAAPHQVIKYERLKLGRPAAFLDLASPRDIETEVGKKALLFNLDSLNAIVEQNKKLREELLEKGQGMIDAALMETVSWLNSTGVDQTIESLQLRCDEIVADSYEYLNRKLTLNSREQKILKKILKASLRRLLREPILELKHTESKRQQDEYQKMLNELFQLKKEE